MKKVKNSIWVWIIAILLCIGLIVLVYIRTDVVEVQNANPGMVPSDYEQGIP